MSLRLIRQSSEQIVLALENAQQDKDSQVADAATRALEADAHLQMMVKMGRPATSIPKRVEQMRKEREALAKEREAQKEALALASILIVTTPSIDKHVVKQHLGIISAEVVLGTGIFSERDGTAAAILGTRVDRFQSKLQEAREIALRELRQRAYELHANAVLGVDLDYSVMAVDILMLVANGTAVLIEPTLTEAKLNF